jgi:hypothetical protein
VLATLAIMDMVVRQKILAVAVYRSVLRTDFVAHEFPKHRQMNWCFEGGETCVELEKDYKRRMMKMKRNGDEPTDHVPLGVHGTGEVFLSDDKKERPKASEVIAYTFSLLLMGLGSGLIRRRWRILLFMVGRIVGRMG